jgi:hypothetical protein
MLKCLVAGLSSFLLISTAHAYEACENGAYVSDVIGDATLRQRIVDTAVDEWRQFGFQVLDLSTSEWEADLSPLLGFSVPLGEMPRSLVGQPKGRLVRMGFAETEPDIVYRIRTYWRAVVADDRFVDGVSLSETAWSSAFVAFVMCRAGLSDEQFRRRDAHVLYVGAAFQDENAYGDTAQNRYAYLARPATSTPVRPGDLACFSEAGMSFEERRHISIADAWSGRDLRSHCDIVVGFSSDGSRVLAIGGNVQHSVTMSVFAARRDGGETYLLGPEQWRAARPFYAVMQLRARPDLASAATIRYARPTGPVG